MTKVITDLIYKHEGDKLTSQEFNRLVEAVIENQGRGVTVDDSLNSSSTNPVQNKVINDALHGKVDTNQIGVANGVAPLGADGKVPTANLPLILPNDVMQEPGGGTPGQILEKTEDGYEWADKPADGTDGADGADGKSAYEIAQDNGFDGSEQKWLASLKAEFGGYIPAEYGTNGEPDISASASTLRNVYIVDNDASNPTGSNLYITVSDGGNPPVFSWQKVGETGLSIADIFGSALSSVNDSTIIPAKNVSGGVEDVGTVTAKDIKNYVTGGKEILPEFALGIPAANEVLQAYTDLSGTVGGDTGDIRSSETGRYCEIAIPEGAKQVRFLGLTVNMNSHTNYTSGWAFVIDGGDGEDYTIHYPWKITEQTESTKTVEIIADIPEGATHFRTTCKTGTLTIDDFYCYFRFGDTMKDYVDGKVGIDAKFEPVELGLQTGAWTLNSSGQWAAGSVANALFKQNVEGKRYIRLRRTDGGGYIAFSFTNRGLPSSTLVNTNLKPYISYLNNNTVFTLEEYLTRYNITSTDWIIIEVPLNAKFFYLLKKTSVINATYDVEWDVASPTAKEYIDGAVDRVKITPLETMPDEPTISQVPSAKCVKEYVEKEISGVSVEPIADMPNEPTTHQIVSAKGTKDYVDETMGVGNLVEEEKIQLSQTRVERWFNSSGGWIGNSGNNYCSRIDVSDVDRVFIQRLNPIDRGYNVHVLFSSSNVDGSGTPMVPLSSSELSRTGLSLDTNVGSKCYVKMISSSDILDIYVPEGAIYMYLELKNGSAGTAKTYSVTKSVEITKNRLKVYEQELNQTRSQLRTYPKVYQGEYVGKNTLTDDNTRVTIGAVFGDYAIQLNDGYMIAAIRCVFSDGTVCDPNKVTLRGTNNPLPQGICDTYYGGDHTDAETQDKSFYGIKYTNPNIGHVIIVKRLDGGEISKDASIIKEFDFLDGYKSVGYNRNVDTAQERSDAEIAQDSDYFKSCVRRAKKMIMGRWSPVKKLTEYNSLWNPYVYAVGATYTGFPYSQIMERNRGLGFATHIRTFYTAVKNPRSLLNTEVSGDSSAFPAKTEYGLTWYADHGQTYYGLVCSNLVEYIMGMSHIYSTSQFYTNTSKSFDGGTLTKRNGVNNLSTSTPADNTLAACIADDPDYLHIAEKCQPLDIFVCPQHTFMCLDVLNDENGNRKYVVVVESISPTFKVIVCSVERFQKRINANHHQVLHYTQASGRPETTRWLYEDAELVPKFEQVDDTQYPNMEYPYNHDICPYKGDWSIYWSDANHAEQFYLNCKKGSYTHIIVEKKTDGEYAEETSLGAEIVNDTALRVMSSNNTTAKTARIVPTEGIDADWHDVNMSNLFVGQNGLFRACLADAGTEAEATKMSDWCYFEFVDCPATVSGNTVTCNPSYGTATFACRRFSSTGGGDNWATFNASHNATIAASSSTLNRVYVIVSGEYGQATRVMQNDGADYDPVGTIGE